MNIERTIICKHLQDNLGDDYAIKVMVEGTISISYKEYEWEKEGDFGIVYLPDEDINICFSRIDYDKLEKLISIIKGVNNEIHN